MKRCILLLVVAIILFAGCAANNGQQEVDERTLSFFDLSISEEKSAEIAQAHAAYVEKHHGSPPVVDLTFSSQQAMTPRYYGTFDETVVWYEMGTSEGNISFEIAGSHFWNNVGCTFFAYRDGEIYTMEEAYLLGYLSAADVAIVAKRHKEFTDSLFG